MYIKSTESRKFSYFRQSDVYEILALAVFDCEDPKSKSWHRAKKIIFCLQIDPHNSFRTKNRVYFGRRLKPKNRTNLETLNARKFFGFMHEKSHFFLIFIKILNESHTVAKRTNFVKLS